MMDATTIPRSHAGAPVHIVEIVPDSGAYYARNDLVVLVSTGAERFYRRQSELKPLKNGRGDIMTTRTKQRFLAFDDRVKPVRDDDKKSTQAKMTQTLPCRTTQQQWKKANEHCRQRGVLPF